MKALHFWKNLSIEKDVGDDTGLFLANKKGGYAAFCFPNISRYNGFFVFDGSNMFKIIEDIKVSGSGKMMQLKNYFYCADAYFERCRQRFFIPSKTNTLAVELDGEKEIELFFDIKKSFDNDDKGRMYDIKIRDDRAVITYRKMKGESEDYKLCVVVKANGKIEKKDVWAKKDFPFDRKRNSPPFEWYTYNCLKLKADKFLITAYIDLKKAEKESSDIFSSYSKLLETDIKLIESFSFPTKVPLSIGFAYLSCWNSMKGLVYDKSMFAGFPWFFQFWCRDSAISSKALIDSGDYSKAQTVLRGILSMLDYKGNMKTKIGYYITPESAGLKSADAVGWSCLRLSQLIAELNKKGILRMYISKKDEKEFAKMVENAVFLLKKFKTKDDLAVNDRNETWMDTDTGGDIRLGARIEMQALRLTMYRFAYELTLDKEFKDSEDKLKEIIRSKFWDGSYLKDGADDPTVRPNIFLAAYIYPDLLSKEEWIACFSSVMPKLWLEWGGLSTIDKSNKLFCNEYTGEDNRSYHRGDSWFWINNYAALVLSRFGDKQFKPNIGRLIEASCEEILWKGMLGCHAELSSAKELRSEGCWSQLWSSASFIEMVNELYLKK
jgi:hypothetical protein